ncbi:complement decay-accelerating factor isoform X1 [Sus scrofa]|uniref:complement decay-accelerating factor isoform X1 n=1 Tax=Sus scrofa TaxID=9823 RepID=UPI000A2B542B|nr:complement decay-accelerating factor isoform X1 [Sus scrofa]
MSPLPRSAPAVRRLMGGQTPPPLLLLLLLLCIPAAQGDCSLPPDVPNAQPDLRGLASFPEQTTITYKCNKGFVKVPGMADSVLCLNDKWSEVAEFCNRSCDVPTRLHFASLKKSYSKQNYFPEGFTVEYECRKGYKRDLTLSEKLTCLQNFTWSKPDEFCKKKQCPTPGELKNGHVNITTDLLFGASIFFSCNAGYRLVGATSSYCFAIANDVEWSDPLPECQEISPTVKAIPAVEKPITVNFPGTKALSSPQKPSTANTLATELLPTPQEPTTVNVPDSKAISSPQKPSTVNTPATDLLPTPQEPTTVNVPDSKAISSPQKPSTVNTPATDLLPTPQEPTTVNVPDSKAISSPQKPSTVNTPATDLLPTPQEPTTVNVPDSKAISSPQKPSTVNTPATDLLPTPQEPTTVNVPAPEVPSTSQKPSTANDSATRAPSSPISNTLSTAAQNPIMANASAPQATSTTQRFTTAKASLTQTLRETGKSTPVHTSKTKGLQQRLTSAHVTATKYPAIPRATTSFHSSTSKNRGNPSSGMRIMSSGKFGSPAVKRNCLLCRKYHPYSWKRILLFNCLRNTIKMHCLWVPKRKWINALYRRVLWTPFGTRYVVCS